MRSQVTLIALAFVFMISPERVMSQNRTLEELDDWMINELNSSGVSPNYLKSSYNALLASSRFGSNCDTVHLAAFIWCQLEAQLKDEWEEPFPLDVAACPVKNHALHYALGMIAYYDWDLKTMESQMRLALETSTDDYHRHVSWQGLGLAFQFTDRLDSAYIAFEESYKAAPDEVDAMAMNNLANAALLAEKDEAALHWTKKAEEAYYAAIRSGRPAGIFGSFFPDLVLSNRLLAEMQLMDTLAADSTFDRMPFHLVDDPMGVMLGATSVAYLLWRDRQDRFELLSPALTDWLAMDSAQAVEVMGAHVLLCEPWRQNWLSISGMKEEQLWDFVRDLPLEFRDVAMPLGEYKLNGQVADASFQAKSYLPPLAVFSALGSLLCFLWVRRRKIQINTAEHPQLIQWVEDAFEGTGSTTWGRLALRRLVGDFNQNEVHPEFEVDVTGLTPRELDIYEAWLRGERPKTTASRTGISASAVYNLRVLVKKKLGVPEGVEFEDWIRAH